MPRTATVSDEKIVKTLSRRQKPFTAAELSDRLGATISTTRLNSLTGVEVVGSVPSEGRRGRPARLYTAYVPVTTEEAREDAEGDDE
jgi:predicted ArsR family transcriptional regulator